MTIHRGPVLEDPVGTTLWDDETRRKPLLTKQISSNGLIRWANVRQKCNQSHPLTQLLPGNAYGYILSHISHVL